MVFWIKREKENLTDGRKIKQADISGFVPPVFVTEREIKTSDVELIEKLKASFEDAGVIGVEEELVEENEQSIEEIVEIIQEANEML